MKRLFMVLLIVSSFTSCWMADELSYDIKYTVECDSGTVFITYENNDGDTSQRTEAETPWEYKFKGAEDDFLYVSAQNNQDYGSITVKIKKDGKVIAEDSCDGEYCIATASDNI